MSLRTHVTRYGGMLQKQFRCLVLCGIVLVSMTTFFIISGKSSYQMNSYDYHISYARIPPRAQPPDRKRAQSQFVFNPARFKQRNKHIPQTMKITLFDNRSKLESEEVEFNKDLNNYNLMNLSSLPQHKVISYAKIVIVIAYMRTGSTLMGKLIEQHPGTFYLFEPIRSIWEAMHKGRGETTFSYLDGTKRTYNSNKDLDHVLIEEITLWATCRLDQLSVMSLNDAFHWTSTLQAMHRYYACASSTSKGHVSKPRNVTIIASCLKDAVKSCQNAPVIALKFIRLRMRLVERLLHRFPNMKVVYLHRDPRGVINSRFKMSGYKQRTQLSTALPVYCSVLMEDLCNYQQLVQRFPQTFMHVYYEDFADKPMEMAKEIYDFIGLPFTYDTKTFVINSTSAKRDTCQFCTERSNSSATAREWRMEMNISTALQIQTTCSSSNSILGYSDLMSTIDLRNLTIQSRIKYNLTQKLLDIPNLHQQTSNACNNAPNADI